MITREPGSEGKCATEPTSIQNYAYDTADQLDESGVTYDPFGNTTTLPAADAGGTSLTSSYYVNDTLASQEQNGQKITYNLDPAGRDLETVTKEGVISTTVDSHYAGPEGTPAWTIFPGDKIWTRHIAGAGGGLTALETKGAAPELELADLHGDIIATAKLTETDPKPTTANETSEYGVPRTTVTAHYSWLGTDNVRTELATGIINMGARTYIPQLGRFEQTDPQPGGSINAYAYAFDDPVNEADPSGETTTYNYEAAEAGEAQAGLPEQYGAPGAIKPPPANLQAQAEFAAHPPWDAVLTFNEGVGGGHTTPIRVGGITVVTDPDDKSPYVQSECNKTGQKCSGCRSGGTKNKKGECQTSKPSGANDCLGEQIVTFVGGTTLTLLFPPATPYVIGVGGVVAIKCDGS